ncbi:hypothetical protein GUITHDRAFT_161535 [Guillardia theta CCMP2712]|uniref:PDZ domain-containing protein n=1 Tax=Guillardia theta (strain CCMP2712) TaxID=905079 RepID=L1JT54_GUITC|nr:hypothetical protein GUITHDRAFT_161535 [Guillardia theta CCMP2712]EKX51489.1 hypothetical protein GUITHDRAFT_161535 [Guillardia theta CCMP2712]|eukprot:XP_005838469.1 hypothetical protein GUITHDRAFT_161535 [Guillardia theta CCMP2712]
MAAACAWTYRVVTKPNPNRIDGKTILLTGITSRSCAAICQALAKKGATLILVGSSSLEAEPIVRSISELELACSLHVRICDLKNGKEIEQMASEIIKTHGLPDIVIHCSCDLPRTLKSFPSTTNYEITTSIQDGLLMPIFVSRAFVKSMVQRKSGALVFVENALSKGVWSGAATMVTTSVGVRGLASALSADVRGSGVQIQVGTWHQIMCIPKAHGQEILVPTRETGDHYDSQDVANFVIGSIRNRLDVAAYGFWYNWSIWDVLEKGRFRLFQMFGYRASRFHDFRPAAISKKEGMGETPRDSPRKMPTEVTSAAGEWIKKGSPNKNSARPPVPKCLPDVVAPSPRDALVQDEVDKSKTAWKSIPDDNEAALNPELPKVLLLVGIGIMLSEEHNGLQIVSINPGSPAAQCKDLSCGDVVIAVDGMNVKGKSCQEVLDMIQGGSGTTVCLTTRPSGLKSQPKQITLHRGHSKDSAWINKT